MKPATSRATSFSGVKLRVSISAEALMVPSGFRSSCARPAESCPRAASRSDRRMAASASLRLRFAAANCSATLLDFFRLFAIGRRQRVDQISRGSENDEPQKKLLLRVGVIS